MGRGLKEVCFSQYLEIVDTPGACYVLRIRVNILVTISEPETGY